MAQTYKPRRTFRFWKGKVPKTAVEHTLELTVDWDAIYRDLGQKAANNRSGRSAVLGGAIVVKVHPTS